MAISKDLLRECIVSQREMITSAEIVERPYHFEDGMNYVLVGVRHVGKSYLLYQRIRQLLAQGHTWNNVLFLNFDDERLAEMTTLDLNLILEVHGIYSEEKPILFLDEIQRIEHWEQFARRLVDSKYTIYITGSNAKMLSSEVATTLGGRFLIQEIYPFSFGEFIAAKGITLDKDWLYSTTERSVVQRAYLEYFTYGGLPEILGIVSPAVKRSYLSSLYQKIYLGDICARHRISDAKALNILIKKIAESVKQPVSYRRLNHVIVSTGSKMSLPTTISYMDYTEESWLILPIKNQLAQLSDKESTKKYYLIDNGLLNLFLYNGETTLLENIVGIELCRRYGKDNVSYYNAGNEIDFVVEDARLAIQVTYAMQESETRERELTPLAKFQSQHPDWTCLLITNDDRNSYSFDGQELQAIPAYQWLLG